jgi:phosphoribosylformimino-5-aminoimidazole carboxamide ribotide isomerase
MYIIPAIDIIGGKCVRLSQGDYNQVTQYFDDPLDAAMLFEDNGIKKLHLVDLDGAKEKRIINYKTLEKIASKTKLHIDFGGGLQSNEDLRIAFECGAKQVTGGSIAVKNPPIFLEWLQVHGSEKIILGSDTKDRMIAVHGWQETSTIHLFDFLADYVAKGVKYTISTDVSKDGMLQGPSLEMYKEMKEKFENLHIIASGGVSSVQDLENLKQVGVYGVIVGKGFYEGRISVKDLARFS